MGKPHQQNPVFGDLYGLGPRLCPWEARFVQSAVG